MCRKSLSISLWPNRFILTAALMMVFSPILSCGYSMKPAGESISPDVQTVFVESFENRTSEAKIENTFRSAFIEQFVKGGRFKLAGGKEEAHAVLSGVIKSMTAAPVSYKNDNLAAEERMTVVLELNFRTRNPEKVIWVDKNFPGSEFYILSRRNLSDIDISRRNALTKLARDMAEKAYILMLSGF